MNKLTSKAGDTLPAASISAQEILSWAPTVDPPTAGAAFGLARSTSFQYAREGRFPCKVVQAGKHYRVVTADLIRVLGLSTDPGGLHG